MNRLTLRSRSVLYGGQYNYFSAALRWSSLQPFQSGRTAGLLRLCPRARIHSEGVKRRNVWKVLDVSSGNEFTFLPVQILNTTRLVHNALFYPFRSTYIAHARARERGGGGGEEENRFKNICHVIHL